MKQAILKSVKKRFDGWINRLTGLGIFGRDKRISSEVETRFLDKKTLEALYQVDEIAARIVNRLPEDMLREGFKVNITGDKNKIEDKILLELERLDAYTKLENALKLANPHFSPPQEIGSKSIEMEICFGKKKYRDNIEKHKTVNFKKIWG